MISEPRAVTLVPGLEPNARNAGETRLAAGGCLQACTGKDRVSFHTRGAPALRPGAIAQSPERLLCAGRASPSPAQLLAFAPGRSRLWECGRRDWCLSSALAFPLDLGVRPPCRGLRGWGCANCQSLPEGELFQRERKRPRLLSQSAASPPRRSAARRESGSRCPWLGEAAPQPECCSVCAQNAPARLGLLWNSPPA